MTGLAASPLVRLAALVKLGACGGSYKDSLRSCDSLAPLARGTRRLRRLVGRPPFGGLPDIQSNTQARPNGRAPTSERSERVPRGRSPSPTSAASPPSVASPRGIALVIVLLSISLLSAIGLALVLSSAVDRLAATNHDEALTLINAAEAGLEIALQDLAAVADWNTVLSGAVRSSWVDGPPGGIRRPSPLVTVDLTRTTNELTCGRPTSCTDPQIRASTSERPWGSNNPRWQPYVHANLTSAAHPRQPSPSYVVVWVGDDGSEVDGNVAVDGGGSGGEGRYILRVRADAFGAQGTRRAIEAVVARVCTSGSGGPVCLPGIRVQSWHVVTAGMY